MHRTTVSIEYPDGPAARTVARSVGVETGEIEGDRTTATLDRDGATVTVDIEATDLVALRAGQNTWLSLLSVAESVRNSAAERA
ncbi:MAG: KEOPS complex subunit Pcc1 [Halanaeroarchaeum sp.]